MSSKSAYVNHVSFDDLSAGLCEEQLEQRMQKARLLSAFSSQSPRLLSPTVSNSDGMMGSPRDSYFAPSRRSLSPFETSGSSSASYLNNASRVTRARSELGVQGPELGRSLTEANSGSNSSSNASITRLKSAPGGPVDGWTSSRPRRSSLKTGSGLSALRDEIDSIDLSDSDPEMERVLDLRTAKNTQENSGSSKGYTTSAFSNLNEPEDKVMRGEYPVSKQPETQRRKTLAGMSDAEVLALEQKYESQSRTNYNMEQFDFGKQADVLIDSQNSKNLTSPANWSLTMYPSRPCVRHQALALTKVNRNFEKCLHERYGDDIPEAVRTVMCYISGREHTWSSVDWFVENMAKDGDHLVIVSCVCPYEELLKVPIRPSGTSLDEFDFGKQASNAYNRYSNRDAELTTLRQDLDRVARHHCTDLLNYYATRCVKKCIKISVELIKDKSTTSAWTSALALYKPDLQIVSTVSTNLQIKFKNSNVKLPFFVMRHYWTPTLVVPYEFIEPKKLKEGPDQTVSDEAKKLTTLPYEELLAGVDRIIKRTLKNPFEKNANNDSKNANDADASSINAYFPASFDTDHQFDEFERLGYLRPVPTHMTALSSKASSRGSGKSSRRCSRIQFMDDRGGIYKVKSLIDPENSITEDKSMVRKTKSATTPTPHTNLSRRSSAYSRETRKSTSSQPETVKNKKSGKLSGFFKKLGFNK
ncbi:LAMI_0G02146g1_1 [Lachancea mirantina]|uniref:LAMI_0G02146g1_1 n=1 Tax=Lachancea mirantina TaxID=1230905 RepID=A0A1G4K7N2_9SACH|nr:LAMI_0G02146g1_1 [Lachancea mirantina]